MASAQRSVSYFYFTAFMAPAVAVAYLAIWLDHRGLSESQIGLLNAAPMMATLILSVFVGRLADKARDWKQTILIGQVLSALFAAFLGVPDGFVGILLVWTIAMASAIMVGPTADAATIRLGQRNGFSFGTVRAWGTAGFLIVSLLTGFMATWFGPNVFLWLFAGLSVVRLLTATMLPQMRDPDARRALGTGKFLSSDLRAALRPWVVLPLIAGALIFATHMVMNAFAALVWADQGISEGTIGALIAVAAGAEAVTMFLWHRFELRLSARHLMLLAAGVAALRWIIMSFEPGVPALFAVQLMQSLSFTIGYLGGMYFIAKRTDETISAEAQSFFAVLMQLGTVVAVSSFGALYQGWSTQAFYFCAALCVLAAGLLMMSLKMHTDQEAAASS